MSIHIASLIKHSQILAYNIYIYIYIIRKLMISLPVFLEKFEASLWERENKIWILLYNAIIPCCF